ncbi:ubiquitin-like protein Pup [Zhihengliuella sp.]|uniref:ubiquitin-like protein Pup n=1 Tax=Zhihengliuella sp. TaxID=1954483 RepID=UPI00281237CC|nr:ubiquitin-like protein Pup [Zhihengliuella sp.]
MAEQQSSQSQQGSARQGLNQQSEETHRLDAPVAQASAQQQAQLQEVDDLLDEIDGVLETNAEEFVRGFVQKGGQ